MSEDKKLKRKRRRVIILSVIGSILLIFIVFQMIQYYRLKNEANRIMDSEISLDVDSEIDIVGLLDSYGVPYSPSVDRNFVSYLSDKLEEKNHLGSKLDLFNLYINKTWHLNGLYENRVTIGEQVEMQNFSLDFVRHKYEGMVKDDLRYECEESLKDVTIYDYTSGLEHPVILYSCSANDLFYYYGFSLEHLNAQKCMELISKFNRSKDELGNHIEGNINTLIECNPKSQIFVMGLYVPSDNIFIQRAGASVIDQINGEIEKVCKKFNNVYYVDVSCLSFTVLEGDFHPNADGQYILAAKLAEAINMNYKDMSDVPLSIGEIAEPEELDEDIINKYRDYEKNIYDSMTASELPLGDPTEASVAIEYALNECDIQDIDYRALDAISEDIIKKYDADMQDIVREGMRINIIERKILNGITESDNSSHPENVKNDKLGLIEYY